MPRPNFLVCDHTGPTKVLVSSVFRLSWIYPECTVSPPQGTQTALSVNWAVTCSPSERAVESNDVIVSLGQHASRSMRDRVIVRRSRCTFSFCPDFNPSPNVPTPLFLPSESTSLLIPRRPVLQASSTVLSFGIGLHLLPFQMQGAVSLFLFLRS